jgi:hypothetical protein
MKNVCDLATEVGKFLPYSRTDGGVGEMLKHTFSAGFAKITRRTGLKAALKTALKTALKILAKTVCLVVPGLLLILLAGEAGAQQAAPGAAAVAAAAPATILIIRHGEKLTDGRMDLSPAGFERANLLPNLFVPGARPDLPVPQVLFATHQSACSNREVETVAPLAAALHLPIDESFSNDDYAQLATILLSGKYAGKVVLVVWHHGKIPQLAAALGATPPYTQWPGQSFDRIWRIDYLNGAVTLKDLPSRLMPGDSK